jgi:anti-sigma factor RsiW
VIPPRCLIIQGNLGRFVDGELDGGRTATVREHLRTCARCLEAERMARAIPVMLSSSLEPPPPPALLPRLISTFRRRHMLERRATVTAAAVALLLTLGALAGPRLLPAPPRPASPAGAPAVVMNQDPEEPLAASRPASPAIPVPSVSSGLTPPVQVGQVTVPRLTPSPCPARWQPKNAASKTAPCQTEPTSKRANTR